MSNGIPVPVWQSTRLIGRRVLRAVRGSESIGMSFEGDFHLVIWGPARLIAEGKPLGLERIDALLGRVLMEFVGDEREERMTFAGHPQFDLVVTVDVAQCTGPEAMMLTGPDHLIVVWN
jgi:hypothetical protein